MSLKVGFIGWRGMVGSVLLDRMRAEGDFAGLEPVFFSTSQAGQSGPPEAKGAALRAAQDLDALSDCDVLVSCQGGEYTQTVYPRLRKQWSGYWIDAASTLRMDPQAVIVLDPVNGKQIQTALDRGIKTFAGGNCTVSLMLMAAAPLFQAGLVEWLISMTYQAASGAGAAKMLELVQQMKELSSAATRTPAQNALEVDRAMTEAQRSTELPQAEFGAPLAGSLIPWIDKAVPNGQTKEEWKGSAETNKILGLEPPVPVDGICVRVGTMRCHSQALCFKLRREVPLTEVEQLLASGNQWVRVIPNEKEASLHELTPTKVSGTLSVPIGRLHKLNMGPEFLGAFTVGDQLLWGAAEPLRRVLRIVRGEKAVASTV